MANSKVTKIMTCLGLILYLSGCAESGSGSSTRVTNNSIDDEARVTLHSNISTVEYDGSITLSWSTSKMQDCVASGDWSGNKNSTGSEVISSLILDSTFELTCTEIVGEAEAESLDSVAFKGRKIKDTVNVRVKGPKAPTISLSSSPTNVSINGSTTINWSSKHSSSCTASGDWSGNMATSGSQTINAITTDSTFNLTCSGAGGNSSDSVSVTVSSPTTPTVNLSASPSSLPYNGSTTLSWNSANVNDCVASGDWSGSKATSGSQTVSALTSTSSFNLTCSGAGGSANKSVNVTVAAPLPTLSFSASPGTVSQNGSTTLNWSAIDATGCTASGDWSGTKDLSGAVTISSLTNDSQFTLTCNGAGGTVNETVNVMVVLNNNGTALLSWTPPTENTDGSQLTDLAGYKIRYGTSPGSYSDTITINNPGLTSYLVENLASSDWYFVMTSFNSSGIESGYSTEVSKTVN